MFAPPYNQLYMYVSSLFCRLQASKQIYPLFHFHLTHALTEYPALSPPQQTPLWNESEILSCEAQQFVIEILYTFLENLFKVFPCCQSVCLSVLKEATICLCQGLWGDVFFRVFSKALLHFLLSDVWFRIFFSLPKNRKKRKAWQPKKFLG